MYTPWAKKGATKLLSTSSPNINQFFLKFVHWHNLWKICNIFNYAYRTLSAGCVGEKIVKIGQYLGKIWTNICWYVFFLIHGVALLLSGVPYTRLHVLSGRKQKGVEDQNWLERSARPK